MCSLISEKLFTGGWGKREGEIRQALRGSHQLEFEMWMEICIGPLEKFRLGPERAVLQ